MNPGHFFTAWTIRLALVCFVVVLAMFVSPAGIGARWRTARTVWSVGCALFVAHVIGAFAFYHHWSHQAAFDDTAKQTRELMGWEFGQGIYVSYVFLVAWIADTAWWWIASERYLQRAFWMRAALYGFLLFIAFNGSVVFKGGIVRAGGIVATAALASLAIRATLNRWQDLEKRAAPRPTPQTVSGSNDEARVP